MSIKPSTKLWRQIVRHYYQCGTIDELTLRWFRRYARLIRMLNLKAPQVIIEHERQLVTNMKRLIEERIRLLGDYVLEEERDTRR